MHYHERADTISATPHFHHENVPMKAWSLVIATKDRDVGSSDKYVFVLPKILWQNNLKSEPQSRATWIYLFLIKYI